MSFNVKPIQLNRMKMIETEILTEEAVQVKVLESEERQTIVHCSTSAEYYRIWPSTFLVERGTGKRAKILNAFNISFYPDWTENDGKGFTLIFEGLSKECTFFDLLEIIPEGDAFEIKGIQRNQMDVYRVRFS
jgi:hypothetical protein